MNKKIRTFVIATSLIVAILIIGATTEIMNMLPAKARKNCDIDMCGGAGHGKGLSTLDPGDLEPYRPCGPNCY